MDTFFQTLRDIQKKERATGTLSEVDEGFYGDASKYLQDLLKIVNDNPLSLEAYQLRDAQRITSEICERREVKIITSAITNVQRSHNLFKGHQKDSQLYEEIPYNTTPEEEQLYRQVVDQLISYREGLISNVTPQKKKTNKIGFKPIKNDDELVEDIPNVASVDNGQSEVDADNTEVSTNIEAQTVTDNSAGNLLDITDNVDNNISENTSANVNSRKLDASQVAAMFGQAPDDVLLDEENNPVKQHTSRSMTAPFKGPKVPEYDTVSLQKDKKSDESASTDSIHDSNENSDISQENIQHSQAEEVTSKKPKRYTNPVSDNITSPNNQTKSIDNTSQSDKSASQSFDEKADNDLSINQESSMSDEDNQITEDLLDSEELVEFINILPTDVLDEDEKTYGPFEVHDVALLPKSIVRILKNNNVINLIK